MSPPGGTADGSGELAPLAAELAAHTPQELREIADPAEAIELARVVLRRTQEVLDFWKPLLEQCRDGKTKAPIKDLRATLARVRALSSALYGSQDERADKAMAALGKAERALEQWIPEAPRGSHLLQTTYEGKDADERPEEKPDRRRLYAMLSVLLVLAALAAGQRLFDRHVEVQAGQLAAYQDAVAEVTARQVLGDTLVLGMDPSWKRKPATARTRDVLLLMERTAGEPVNQLRLEDDSGRALARILPNGTLEWGAAVRSSGSR